MSLCYTRLVFGPALCSANSSSAMLWVVSRLHSKQQSLTCVQLDLSAALVSIVIPAPSTVASVSQK